MNLQTNYDELLLGATMGVTPTDAEVANVVPIPGQGDDEFAADVWTAVADIQALRRQGLLADARRLASQLGAAYLAAFDTTPKPRRAGGVAAQLDPSSMSPADLADAVRNTTQYR